MYLVCSGFCLPSFGDHGMGYCDRSRGGSDYGDGYRNGGRNLLGGGRMLNMRMRMRMRMQINNRPSYCTSPLNLASSVTMGGACLALPNGFCHCCYDDGDN